MRLKFKFSKNSQPVPNNISVTNSWLHKCLGNNNDYHDNHSNYCVSRMSGGLTIENGRYFDFPNGGYIIISSNDTDFIGKIMSNVNNVDFGYGMKFEIIQPIQEELFDGYNFFKTMDTGILLKTFKEGKDYFHTINDEDFIEVLTERTVKRLKSINPKLNFDKFKIEITNNVGNYAKRTFVHNRANMSSVCQLIIHSNKKVAEAIYTHGLGQSTGSGFGTIYKLETKNMYARN